MRVRGKKEAVKYLSRGNETICIDVRIIGAQGTLGDACAVYYLVAGVAGLNHVSCLGILAFNT
jgi:hypothetical protein